MSDHIHKSYIVYIGFICDYGKNVLNEKNYFSYAGNPIKQINMCFGCIAWQEYGPFNISQEIMSFNNYKAFIHKEIITIVIAEIHQWFEWCTG